MLSLLPVRDRTGRGKTAIQRGPVRSCSNFGQIFENRCQRGMDVTDISPGTEIELDRERCARVDCQLPPLLHSKFSRTCSRSSRSPQESRRLAETREVLVNRVDIVRSITNDSTGTKNSRISFVRVRFENCGRDRRASSSSSILVPLSLFQFKTALFLDALKEFDNVIAFCNGDNKSRERCSLNVVSPLIVV